jgi:hypothetical protein
MSSLDDAHADPVELLVRLEVDVRSAQVDRIQQDLVEELDDRRVLDLVGLLGRSLLGFFLGEFDVGVVAGQVVERLLGALGQAREQVQQHIVRDDHRLHRRFALELDLVERLGVGRVRYGQRHAVAALGQRDDPLRLHQAGVDRAGRDRFHAVGRQVQHRVAEGLGAEAGQRRAVDALAGEQGIDELGLFRARALLQRVGLRHGQAAGLDQRTRQTGHRRA